MVAQGAGRAPLSKLWIVPWGWAGAGQVVEDVGFAAKGEGWSYHRLRGGRHADRWNGSPEGPGPRGWPRGTPFFGTERDLLVPYA